MNWKKWGPVFLGGLLMGGAAMHVADRWRPRRFSPERKMERMLHRLDRKLNLVPEQRAKIAAILEESRKHVDALHGEVRPRFDQIRQQTDDQIRLILTSEQQVRFSKLQERWRSRREARGPGWDRH